MSHSLSLCLSVSLSISPSFPLFLCLSELTSPQIKIWLFLIDFVLKIKQISSQGLRREEKREAKREEETERGMTTDGRGKWLKAKPHSFSGSPGGELTGPDREGGGPWSKSTRF